MTPQELRERCERLRDELDKCYNFHVGEVIDLPDGNKDYLPFREAEHEIARVVLLESFARSIWNAAIEESAKTLHFADVDGKHELCVDDVLSLKVPHDQ